MAQYEEHNQLDYRFGGDTIDDFAIKYMAEMARVFRFLNDLKENRINSIEYTEPSAGQFKVENEKLYIRDGSNTKWVLLGNIDENFGFKPAGASFLNSEDIGTGAGQIPVLNENGILDVSISGNAGKIADIRNEVNNLQDGQVLTYRSATNSWRNEDKGVIGSGKALNLYDGDELLCSYAGDEQRDFDLGITANRQYSEIKADEAKAYADQKSNDAKNYADNVSNEAKAYAESVVDSKASFEYVQEKTAAAEASAKSYTDTALAPKIDKIELKNSAVKDSYRNVIYGFRVDNTEADPSACVTYLADAKGMTPARMDYQNNIFDYGSWEDAFFMPRPCMLKYDGTVACYLDPNNYAYREDGVTPSDVANDEFDGNAMMEWGQNGKKIYYKVVNVRDGCYEVYIANYKADDEYVCYSFIGGSNQELDHFYTPIYNGSNVSSRLRSLSGKTHMASQSATTDINYAQANGNGWYIEQWCDRVLINFLLVLMGKSLDTQKTYGNGHYSGGSSASSNYVTGRHDGKGLFWGSTGNDGVKVFGMENWWAEVWRRTAGLMNDRGTYKVKMTANNYDGSTQIGYNTTGDGYINCGSAPSASCSYISRMSASKYGILPIVVSGSASTYYCDAEWTNNGQLNYAYVGGTSYIGSCCGGFAVDLAYAASNGDWDVGACLSYKHS